MKENKSSPITTSMSNTILLNIAVDDDFKRDFVVYVVSTFLWTSQAAQSRYKILKSLQDVSKIKDLNWCKFVIDGLVDSAIKFQQNPTSYFTGPLIFLMVFYMDRVKVADLQQNVPKCIPILRCWTDKLVKERIRYESINGGVGAGKAIPAIELQEEKDEDEDVKKLKRHKLKRKRDVEVEVEVEARPGTSSIVHCLKSMGSALKLLATASQQMKDLNADAIQFLVAGFEPLTELIRENASVKNALTTAFALKNFNFIEVLPETKTEIVDEGSTLKENVDEEIHERREENVDEEIPQTNDQTVDEIMDEGSILKENVDEIAETKDQTVDASTKTYKRKKKASKTMKSPYISIVQETKITEKKKKQMHVYIFDPKLKKNAILFRYENKYVFCEGFQTLKDGEWIDSTLIDVHALMLNFKNKNRTKIFFTGIPLGHSLFIPVIRSGHFFLVCYHMIDREIQIIDNRTLTMSVKQKYDVVFKIQDAFMKLMTKLNSSMLKTLSNFKINVLKFDWQNCTDSINCGVFLMLHMQTYKGTLKK